MSLVILEVREERLIYVKDPSVLAVSLYRDRFSVGVGVTSDYTVVLVKLAFIVISFKRADTLGRNHLPLSGIVGLDGQSPACAVGLKRGRDRFVDGGGELDEG